MNKLFKNHHVLSMEEFIINYLSLDDNRLFHRMNHYDIDELNIEGVKRVPDQMVTEEDLRTGRVLLVESSGFNHKGKSVHAYLRPDIVLLEENPDMVTDLDKMLLDSLYHSDTPLFINKSLKRTKRTPY